MRRMVRATLVAATGLAAIAVAVPSAMAKQHPTPSPDALAVAAADRVPVSNGAVNLDVAAGSAVIITLDGCD